MKKMFRMLPGGIKAELALGCFLTVFYIALLLFLPTIVASYMNLILETETVASTPAKTFTIDFFGGRLQPEQLKDLTPAKARSILNWTIVVQTILTGVFALASTLIVVNAAEKCSLFYRSNLYAKIQKLSLKNIADIKAESIMTRVTMDVAIFWEFLVNATMIFIKSLFIIVGASIISAIVAWEMALSIMSLIPLIVTVVVVTGIKTNPILKKTQKVVDEVTKEVNENVAGIRVIKTFNLEHERMQKFKGINKKWYEYQYKSSFYFAAASPFFFMGFNILVIGILSLVAKKASIGDLHHTDIAKISEFIDYLWLIASGILLALNLMYAYFRAKVSAERILQILEYEVDDIYVEDGKRVNNYDLEIKDLSFKYYETAPNYSLANINLSLPYGQTLGIIGPTGSGKSTLVNLLLNSYVYKEGSITIGGEEIKDLNTIHLHDIVGIVFQEALLYSGTIKSNLLWAKKEATDEEIVEALKDSCAYEYVNKFEDKLDHPIVQGGKNLSGGQKQRLSIARTLLRKPKILILDDSTSALDNITSKKVIQNLKEKYDCSVIIVSQKISAIKDADNILVLSHGGFASGYGKHKQLIKDCEFYRQIYETQLEQ